MNLKHIAQGWVNLIFSNEVVEERAIKRLEICNKCQKRSNYPSEITMDSYCKDCGCVLQAKVRSDSQCPNNYWNDSNSKKDSRSLQ